jgi:hypothetical protein
MRFVPRKKANTIFLDDEEIREQHRRYLLLDFQQ